MRARHRHFNPRDAGANLVYDSRRVTGLSDNDPVSTWTDLSRNAYDATGSSTARPLYKTGVQGGNPALRFDGINDQMTIPVGPTVNTGAGHYVQAVIKQITFQTSYPAILDLKANTTQNWYIFYSNVGSYSWISFGAQSDWDRARWSTTADTNCNIINVTYNGSGATTRANFSLIFNGEGKTLSANETYGGNTTTAGIGAENNNFWNNADYYQIALINVDVSTALRKRLNHAAAFSFKIACS